MNEYSDEQVQAMNVDEKHVLKATGCSYRRGHNASDGTATFTITRNNEKLFTVSHTDPLIARKRALIRLAEMDKTTLEPVTREYELEQKVVNQESKISELTAMVVGLMEQREANPELPEKPEETKKQDRPTRAKS